jgi:hypothetical protein
MAALPENALMCYQELIANLSPDDEEMVHLEAVLDALKDFQETWHHCDQLRTIMEGATEDPSELVEPYSLLEVGCDRLTKSLELAVAISLHLRPETQHQINLEFAKFNDMAEGVHQLSLEWRPFAKQGQLRMMLEEMERLYSSCGDINSDLHNLDGQGQFDEMQERLSSFMEAYNKLVGLLDEAGEICGDLIPAMQQQMTPILNKMYGDIEQLSAVYDDWLQHLQRFQANEC